MRLFGSERIAKLMDRMGLKEGEVIQHSMISKSIERAQRKVKFREQRKEYASVRDKLRAKENTTMKIRDYHSMLM